jgi:16S rRNA (cytosine967-C5)-methyltransferase
VAFVKRQQKDAPPKPDARRLALFALSDVLRGKGYSTLSLGEQLRNTDISPEEKRLATNIFYTTLENLLRIDYVLGRFVETKPEPVIEDILRIGVAQLLFMDRVPDHAVVDEAVKQTKRFRREHASGMVNGVLRAIIRKRDENGIRYPEREEDIVKYLSLMHSAAEDLVTMLAADYGMEEAEAILSYKPETRFETVRPNMLRMTDGEFLQFAEKKGWNYVQGIVPGALRIIRAGDLAGDPDYKDGLYSLQGEAALLAAMALQPKPGQTILDACAAPGGKTAYICEKMHLSGRVYAWDNHEHRVALLQAVRKRLKLDSMRCMVRDATVPRLELFDSFDSVLIDAPCTGIGVMYGKPDIKLNFKKEDVSSLARLQEKILNACAEYPAYGGTLVYSTCTLFKDENERQIEKFLATHRDYERDDDASWLPDALKPLWKDGQMQLFPHRHDLEGFYIARLKRVRR